MVVIMGATGNIGSKLAARLLADGKPVRVIARGREKLESFGRQGAEVAAGDAADAVFLAKTLAGAEAAFLMIPPSLQAEDMDAYQDRLGESIVRALRESPVRHVINLSSIGADVPEKTGPIAGLYRQERRLNGLEGVHVLHVRPGYFMENLFMFIPLIKSMGSAGSAMRPDVKISMISTQDIAQHAAERLQRKDFAGKQVQDLGAANLSMAEAVSILGKSIGKPDLAYVQFPAAAALEGMMGMGLSRSVASGYVEMSQAINAGLVKPVERKPQNTTPTSLEDFAPIFSAAFRG